MTITDFHSHILPNMDHGCKSVDECLEQLELMKNAGTQIAVATPHFYPHIHKTDTFLKNIEISIDSLNVATVVNAPKIVVGAEVLLCEKLELMDGLSKLCIGKTKVLLLELPTEKLRDGYLDTVDALLSNGYTIVLAHIDRYLKLHNDSLDELFEMGALAQVNAQSLTSHQTLKKIKKLILSDRICALGSDLHGTDKALYRRFIKAQKLLGNDFNVIMERTEKLLGDAEYINS